MCTLYLRVLGIYKYTIIIDKYYNYNRLHPQ